MKNEKILLVNPPSPFLLDEKVFPPTGLLYVAAVAREAGHDVKLLDLAGDKNYMNTMLNEAKNKYDLIGFTSTSPQFSYVNQITKELKKQSPVKVAIGGPHPSIVASLRKRKLLELTTANPSLINTPKELETLLYEEDVNFKPLEIFDKVISGEENGIFLALEDNPEKWIDGGITSDLDELPMPARDLINMNEYLYSTNGKGEKIIKFAVDGKPTANVMTQRGCPFDCYFCCGREVPQFRNIRYHGKLRVLSPEKLINELNHLNKEYGLESFMFYDDEFNLDTKRTLDVCEALAKTGYHFRGFVKSELLAKHPEVGAALAKAGFSELLAGIESGSDKMLAEQVRKHTTNETNYAAAKICRENGIGFKALCMIGHPEETYEDAMQTKEWIIKMGKVFKESGLPYTFDITIHQPYPGAPVWNHAMKNKGIFSDEYAWVYRTGQNGGINTSDKDGLFFNKLDFSHEGGYYKGVPGEYQSSVRSKSLSAQRIVELRDQIDAEARDALGIKQLKR